MILYFSILKYKNNILSVRIENHDFILFFAKNVLAYHKLKCLGPNNLVFS